MGHDSSAIWPDAMQEHSMRGNIRKRNPAEAVEWVWPDTVEVEWIEYSQQGPKTSLLYRSRTRKTVDFG